ncbi:MAG: tetratricopeptide repeat protein, partial [Bacteroidota bacterium]
MGDAKKALNHSLLAVDFAEKSSDKNTYLKASYNLANRYYDEGEYELASNLYNETLNLSVENENKDIEAGAYEGLASIYYEQNDLEKVKIYYQKAREIYLQTQDSLMLVTNSRNIGFVEELLGNDLKALIQYQQAEKYLQNKGSITDHFDLMDLISSAYSRMGKYEEADTYKEKQLVMVDSLVTQMQTIEELKLKYTQEENKLQQQRQKQQTLIVSLILLAALITLSFLYYHHHQSKKFHELDKRQMELEAKERERQYRENLEQVFEEQEKKFMDAVLRQEKINNVASQKLHDHVGNTLLSVVWSMEDYLEQQKKNQQTSTFLEKTNKLLYDIYEEVRTVSHRIKDNHFKEGHLLTFDQTEAIATQELVGAIEDLYDKISGDRLQAKVYVSGDVQALDSTIEIKA